MASEGSWKGRALLMGAAVGALTGLGAAYLLVRRAERAGEEPKLSAGEGLRLGLLVLGLLRQVSLLGEGDE
jgi:nitrate reductase gamma subunit